MKRPVIIIVGIVLVLVLLGLWVYILLGGTSVEPTNNFADLNFDDTTDTSIPSDQRPTQNEPLVDVSAIERIKQLTTDPVIGFSEVQKTPTSTKFAYYVQPGTGHIISIDLSSGEEVRVSGTTIPGASKAVVTRDGSHTLIQAGYGGGAEFTVGRIDPSGGSLLTASLEETIIDFTTTSDNTFLYIARNGGSVVGKELDPTKNTVIELFRLPFNEVVIDWGHSSSSIHYAYPRANRHFKGFLYEINSDRITRLPIDGYGLTASADEAGMIYSEQVDGEYKTFFFDKETGNIREAIDDLLPEKCLSLTSTETFVCPNDEEDLGFESLDNWYEGTVGYSDNIWEINPVSGALSYLIDIEAETGRQIDMINLHAGYNDDFIYFQNKNDQTLWVYNYSGAKF